MKRLISLTVFCLVLLATRAVRADEFDHVRQFIRQRMAEEHVPGVTVAVARDGQVIWEEGFGWADVEHHVAANPNTVYSVASVTKPITATALMILCEQGKISLDQPVNSYLGAVKLTSFAGDANEATMMQLASHTAGLPEHYHFFYADQHEHPPAMDETIRRYGIITAPPGKRFSYSNLGYGILGYVISRVTKKDLEKILSNDVFRPLGMKTARLAAGPCSDCAVRYDENGLPIPAYDFDHRGASALWASAHDLVRFGLFQAGAALPDQHRILSESSRLRMQAMPSGGDRGYGIGWNIWRHPVGYDVIYHGGNMPGVSADLTIIPAKHIVVVVLSNRSSSLPYRINDEIVYKTLLPVVPATTKQQSGTQSTGPTPVAPPLAAGTWTGAVHTYAGVRPLQLDIESPQEVYATLGGKKQKLNKVDFANGLHGEFTGDIGISDARPDSLLVLSLRRDGEKLTGTVTAFAPPNARVEYGLSQWVELRAPNRPDGER